MSKTAYRSFILTLSFLLCLGGPGAAETPAPMSKSGRDGAAKPAQASSAAAGTIADGLKALDEKRYDVALKDFNDAFTDGNADAGFYMARMLELGIGLQPDLQKARLLYLAAADKGSAKAMNRVGLMHFRGETVLQDYEAAKGMICKAADLGDPDGAFNCAGLLAEGRGVEKDPTKALSYYEKAAEMNHIGALVALGFAYRDGTGAPADPDKARSYFERAASHGNPAALYQLGVIYEAGKQVPRDLAKAHLYYNLAAARQYPDASEALQRVSATMEPSAVSAAQAEAKRWKAVP